MGLDRDNGPSHNRFGADMITLVEFNIFSRAGFVRLIDPVFEHSPRIAEGLAALRVGEP